MSRRLKINWVIVGGESRHRARPVQKEWIDFVRIKCEEKDVAFFFKQWGKPKFNINPADPTILAEHPQHAKGGCELDGKIYRQMPELAVIVADKPINPNCLTIQILSL